MMRYAIQKTLKCRCYPGQTLYKIYNVFESSNSIIIIVVKVNFDLKRYLAIHCFRVCVKLLLIIEMVDTFLDLTYGQMTSGEF